ncbi:MAG: copper resistance protein CopC [Gammaproteobacteria bacterium]|nr:copper resistance protein CopC [Gammaproteobacteria bacterium]
MLWLPHRSLLAGCLAVSLAASPVWCAAHARLEQAEPARRATLAAAPTQVRLRFSEAVELQYSHLSVTDNAGHVLSTAPTLAADAKTLALALPMLAPGAYSVHYRVLSVDGHVIESTYRFTVRAPAGEK